MHICFFCWSLLQVTFGVYRCIWVSFGAYRFLLLVSFGVHGSFLARLISFVGLL